jgi:type I restriction enzyme S subunit
MSWTEVALVDVCKPKQWKTIPISALKKEGYPVYGANGVIGFYDEFNHLEETLMITCRGATCGTINLSTPKSYITGNAMALDDLDRELCDINFLYYYLSNRGFNDAITGTAQPQITRTSLSGIKIPLPPLSEQKRIAAILNEQMEAVEKARKATEAQLEAAKALPAAYLRAVFESEEANSWERRKLGEICHIIGGNTLPDQIISEVDERVYCLKVSDLDKSFCDNNYINSGQIYTKRSLAGNRIIPPQSIVFPKRGGAIATNKKRILTVNAVLDPNLMAVYPSGKNLSNKYLYFWFESWDLSSIQSGNSVPQINGKDIAPLEIPIPPLPKQQQIASTLTEQMQEVERLKQNLKEQLDTINKLPAVLLRRAFKGEL